MKNCETKKFYDTEFEATIAASKTEGFTGEEMIPYQCGRHWHIAHADRTKSRGYGMYFKCWWCKQIIKRSKLKTHRERCTMKP